MSGPDGSARSRGAASTAGSTEDGAGSDGPIGLIGAAAIGIGGMVGGGIFAVLGVAATAAGGATPLAFMVGGVVAALTAYSYARLSVAMPSAGGTVSFIDRAFGVGWLTGSLNATLWVGYVITTALYASAFGNYATTFLPGDSPPRFALELLTAAGLAVPWLINLANAKAFAGAETAIVGVKVFILVIVVIAGLPSTSASPLSPTEWSGPIGIVAAGMLVFVAYEGFELISNASDDVVRPATTLPRAFALSVATVIVLYVAIAAVVVGSLSPAQITASEDFALAEAASASLGDVGFKIVAVSALLATLSAMNATLYGAARLSYTLAQQGELPERFEHVRWNDPVGLHLTAALGLASALALDLESISAVASAVFLAVFATVNAAAYRAAAEASVKRPVAALGFVTCVAALVVLLVDTVRHNDVATFTLVGLLVTVLLVEHRVLAERRPQPLSSIGDAPPIGGTSAH